MSNGLASVSIAGNLTTMVDATVTTAANLAATNITGVCAVTGGLNMGSVLAGSPTDLSSHLALFGTKYGLNVTSGTINVVSNSLLAISIAGTVTTLANAIVSGPLQVNGNTGFNGTTPIAKPTVTGSKGGNAALGSLMTALANYGLVTDSTS